MYTFTLFGVFYDEGVVRRIKLLEWSLYSLIRLGGPHFCQVSGCKHTMSLEEVIHVARATCENFADQVKEKEIYFNLLLTGRTQIHAELKRKTALEDLQEEIGTYFKGRTPSIWVNLKLNTLGVYDIDSLRHGKDFVADLINLFEVEEKAESFPELEEFIKPMFENWQGKKYLKSLTNQEMKDVLIQAKSLCLDKLLR